MPQLVQTESLFGDPTSFEAEMKRRGRWEAHQAARKNQTDPESFDRRVKRFSALGDLGYQREDISSGIAMEHFAKSRGLETWDDAVFDQHLTESIRAGAKDERDFERIFTNTLDQYTNEGAPLYMYTEPREQGFKQQAEDRIRRLSPRTREFLSAMPKIAQDSSITFGGEGKEGEDKPMDVAREAWVSMTPEEREITQSLLPIVMGKSIERAETRSGDIFSRFGQSIRDNAKDAAMFSARRILETKNLFQGMEPEEIQRANAVFDLEQMAKSARAQAENNVSAGTTVNLGFADFNTSDFNRTVGSSLGEMANAVVSLPMLALSKAGAFESNDILSNPDADAGGRMLRALTAGSAEAALSRAQINLLKLKPNIGKTLQTRFATRLAAVTAAEIPVEMLQEFSGDIVDQVAMNLDSNISQPDFKAKMSAFVEDMPEFTAMMVLLGSAAAGADTANDAQAAKETAWQSANPDILEMMGFSKQEAKEISSIENELERLDAVREKGRKITKKPNPSPETLKRARKALADNAAETGEQFGPTWTQQDDGSIKVSLPDGTETTVATPEQAFAVSRNFSEGQAERSSEGVRELLKVEEGGTSALDQLFEEEKARFAAKQPELAQETSKARSLSQEVREGRVSPERAQRRIRDLSFQEATELSRDGQEANPEEIAANYVSAFSQGQTDFTIQGSARTDATIQNGLLKGAMTLVDDRKDVTTLWEEALESHYHGSINSGLATKEQYIGWIREVEQATGKEILSGEGSDQVAEAVSFLGKAYAAGDLNRQDFSARLRNILDRLSEILMQVVGMAQDIRQLRESGSLNPELEAQFRAGLGKDGGELYQSMVDQRSKELGLEGLIKDETFSISQDPSQEFFPLKPRVETRAGDWALITKGTEVRWTKVYAEGGHIEVAPLGKTANITSIQADDTNRGSEMLDEVRNKFPKANGWKIHVSGAVKTAFGFYNKMKDRGMIDSWSPASNLVESRIEAPLETFALSESGNTLQDLILNRAKRSRGEVQDTYLNAAVALERLSEKVDNGKLYGNEDTGDSDFEKLRDLATYEAILSSLPAEVRGQMGGFPKLASLKTELARENFMVDKVNKLDGILNRVLSQQLRADIKKLVKDNQPKKNKRTGVLEGKGAAMQDELAEIEGVLGMTRDEVNAEEERIEAALSVATEPEAIESLTEGLVRLLTYGNSYQKGKNSRRYSDLLEARKSLETLVKEGKSTYRMTQEAERKRREELREMAMNDITGGKGLKGESEAKKSKLGPLHEIARGFHLQNQSFEWLMNAAARESNQGTLKSNLAKWAGRLAHLATHKERRINYQKTDEMSRFLAGVFGIEAKGAWRFKLSQPLEKFAEEVENTGVYRVEITPSKRKIKVPVEKARQIVSGEVRPEALDLTKYDASALESMLSENDSLPANRQKKSLELEHRTVSEAKEQVLSQDQAVYLSMLYRQDGAKAAM